MLMKASRRSVSLRPVITCAILFSALTGCGKTNPAAPETPELPPVGVSDQQGSVVRARATFRVEVGQAEAGGRPNLAELLKRSATGFWITPAWASSGAQPVSVIFAPSAEMTLDNSQFIVPSPSAALLDFGFLSVQSLQDNNLRVCGASGKTKCREALLRMYTTGAAGPGLYNSTDGYGAPIQAGLTSSPSATIGLDAAGAAVLQSFTIPANKNVLRLSDFSPTPVYQVASDFTNAGAGTYQTTIVLEYVLAE